MPIWHGHSMSGVRACEGEHAVGPCAALQLPLWRGRLLPEAPGLPATLVTGKKDTLPVRDL